MKKHILFIASGPDLAGGEKNLFDIARFLVQGGQWRISAYVPESGLLKKALEELGCQVNVTPLPVGINPAPAYRIAKFIQSEKVDVVHAHGTRAAFHARLAALWVGTPCVYTVHGIHYEHYRFAAKRWIFSALERFMRRWTEWTIFVCQSDMKKGVAAGFARADRSRVIYNGIGISAAEMHASTRTRVRRDLGVPDRQKIVISVGRFHRQKGQIFLVEAAAFVGLKRSDTHFIFVGDGDTLTTIVQKADQLGVQDKVSFLGARSDVNELMAAADLFALPSLWEGLPYVLLEAGLAGVPVVATDVDGVPEVIFDGDTGLLVPSQNARALGEAILEALDDPKLAARMSKGLSTLVRTQFKTEDMMKETEAIYLEATTARPAD